MGKVGKNEFPLPTEFCKNNDSIVQLMNPFTCYYVISHVHLFCYISCGFYKGNREY